MQGKENRCCSPQERYANVLRAGQEVARTIQYDQAVYEEFMSICRKFVQRRDVVTEPANAVKQRVPGCEEGKKRKPKSVRKPERQSSTILVNLLDEITIVEPLPKKMKH